MLDSERFCPNHRQGTVGPTPRPALHREAPRARAPCDPRCWEASVTQDSSAKLGDYQGVVEGMMDAREPFGRVESFIDQARALDGNQKAALWLLAWSMRSGPVQRREASAMLGATGSWGVLGLAATAALRAGWTSSWIAGADRRRPNRRSAERRTSRSRCPARAPADTRSSTARSGANAAILAV